MRWLIAVDLDGTVLSFDLKLDERDVEALHRAVAAGMAVVACTGRPFPGARPWVQKLGLDQPIVCYQGAQIRTPDGRTLLDQGVPHDLAVEVVTFARGRDVHVQAYRDDRLIVERDRPEAHEYANHAGMQIHLVPDLAAAMGPTTPKLVMVAARDAVEALLPEVRSRWAGRLEANTSMPTYLEITNHGADKRRALGFLCERLGISHDHTVAVGDGRNDASMLAWAARGYAVEGATREVVAAAGGRTVGKPGTGGIARLVSELLQED
jgi:Cof subfamily protein (haloacid dehalogenase superfamily)